MITFRRLLGFLQPYRRGLSASWGLASLAMVGTVALPALTGRAVEAIKHGAAAHPASPGEPAGPRARRAADARAGDPGRRAGPLGADRLAADDRRARVAGGRVRPAQADVRPAPAPGARLLRPPADRPADVARDRRPAGGALLPRLRPRVHPAVGAHDRSRGRGDDRDQPGARPDRADPGAVRGGDLLPLRPARAGRRSRRPSSGSENSPRRPRRTSPACAW